jgi:hypothetical protein
MGMACKFCLEEKECIEAHIIPNSLYEPILNDKKGMLIISNEPENYPKKQHTGIYDTNLVCEECERLFSKPDNYAKSFFSADINEDDFIIDNNEKLAYIIKNYDYHNLKLFLISLLWRASASTQAFFSKVNVGPFENQIKEMIKKNDPGDENIFSVTLTRYDNPIATAMLNPFRKKWYGINYYTFYLRGWKTYIKTDNRPAPEIMRDFFAKPDQPLIVLYLNFRQSTEVSTMKKMAKLFESKRIK